MARYRYNRKTIGAALKRLPMRSGERLPREPGTDSSLADAEEIFFGHTKVKIIFIRCISMIS